MQFCFVLICVRVDRLAADVFRKIAEEPVVAQVRREDDGAAVVESRFHADGFTGDGVVPAVAAREFDRLDFEAAFRSGDDERTAGGAVDFRRAGFDEG